MEWLDLPHSPVLRFSNRRRPVALAACLAGFVVFGVAIGASRAQEGPSHPAPIWVPDVVRIDRSKERRERVDERGTVPATPAAEDDRHRFIASPPLRGAEDGSFETTEGRIRIAGIRLPERARLCVTDDGRRWGCGVRALASFSALLTDKRLECRPHGEAVRTPPLYDCLSNRRSIAETLISAGWAEVDGESADARLAPLEAAARLRRLGMWAKDLPP